jgi:hypothetical protein
MERNRNEKKFIIDQIRKSGFSLERHVVNSLIEDSWDVYPRAHFYDKDFNKDRELDVRAEKTVSIEDLQLLLKFHLLIECKKIPGNAWIFFEGPTAQGTTFLGYPRLFTFSDIFGIENELLPPIFDLHYKKVSSQAVTLRQYSTINSRIRERPKIFGDL